MSTIVQDRRSTNVIESMYTEQFSCIIGSFFKVYAVSFLKTLIDINFIVNFIIINRRVFCLFCLLTIKKIII